MGDCLRKLADQFVDQGDKEWKTEFFKDVNYAIGTKDGGGTFAHLARAAYQIHPNRDAISLDLENCFKQIANSKAVCALTMIEVVDYLQAYHLLQVSETKHSVFNPSTVTVFVSVNHKTYKIRPKSSLKLPK
jgi:hypothetical protein